MSLSTESVDCHRQNYPSPVGFTPQTGDFCWSEEWTVGGETFRTIYIRVPGSNTSGYDALKCCKGKDRGVEREWGWDGNEDQPTLTPSILTPGIWHGHMKAGKLESC